MGLHWSNFKGRRVPACWDDCKTKEMRKLFIEELQSYKGKFRSLHDLTFKCYLKEIPKEQRVELRKSRKLLTGQELLDFDRLIFKKYIRKLSELARLQKYEEQLKKTMPVVCSECGKFLGTKGYQCVERLSSGHTLEMVFCNEEHYENWFRGFKDSLEEDKEGERRKIQRESRTNNIFKEK